METSTHYHTDCHGRKYQINIDAEDYVVFDSTPPLCLDLNQHGLFVLHEKYYDYSITYRIQNDSLYLIRVAGRFSQRSELPHIFDAEPCFPYPDKRIAVYMWDSLESSYSGILTFGQDFKHSRWAHDEKAIPVSFTPDAYKVSGILKILNGRVIKQIAQ